MSASSDAALEAMVNAALEAMVNAALAGHDLTPFEPLQSGGYQARCRHCHKTVWINDDGLIYSLLPNHCSLYSPQAVGEAPEEVSTDLQLYSEIVSAILLHGDVGSDASLRAPFVGLLCRWKHKALETGSAFDRARCSQP